MVPQTLSKEDCKFKDTYLLPYLQCPKCDNIFKNPLRMHPCGHTFCQSCSPQKGSLCSTCSRLVQVRQVDLTSSNLIADLQVTCNATGCPFKGTFQHYKNHHRENCPIRKSGSLDCWIQDMQSTLDNLKCTKIKEIEIESEPNASGEMMENQQKIDNSLLNYGLDEENIPKQKPQTSTDKVASRQEETFIECIPLDIQRPEEEIQCRELQGSQLFVNSFFKAKKNPKSSRSKGSNVIEL